MTHMNLLSPTHSRGHHRWILVGILLFLSACSSLPTEFEQVPGQAWSHPEQTKLGAFIAEIAPEDKSLSGVELLADPADAFGARFAIAAFAEKTLDMQYYLWKGDLSGQLLLWRVLEAADRGVKVRFLIDDIYHSGRDEVYAILDTHPNFELRVFNPMANRGAARNLNFLVNKTKLNRRMHNKIFMADGAVAVLGGRNIGDDYFGMDPNANFLDIDILTAGQGAIEAGAAYDEYWNSKNAIPIDVLNDREYTAKDLESLREKLKEALLQKDAVPYALAFTEQETLAKMQKWRDRLIWVDAHVVVDPLERFDGQGESAIVRFAADTVEHLDDEMIIQSAYLIPSKQGLASMTETVARGVRIRLLTNSLMSNNHITAHSGYMKYRKAILKTGAELYELRPDASLRKYFEANKKADAAAAIHTKSFVLDGKQALIGSFNFDPRSRDLNSEIGLVVNDEGFSRQVIEHMDQEFEPANSYRLFLNENGKLRWEVQTGDGMEIHTHDPGASIWRRMAARMMSWLPIEKEL
jgi:putative cardiolipin synthase